MIVFAVSQFVGLLNLEKKDKSEEVKMLGSFENSITLILFRGFYLLDHNVLHLLAASRSLGGALGQNC